MWFSYNQCNGQYQELMPLEGQPNKSLIMGWSIHQQIIIIIIYYYFISQLTSGH
jgi:hypothetical protein